MQTAKRKKRRKKQFTVLYSTASDFNTTKQTKVQQSIQYYENINTTCFNNLFIAIFMLRFIDCNEVDIKKQTINWSPVCCCWVGCLLLQAASRGLVNLRPSWNHEPAWFRNWPVLTCVCRQSMWATVEFKKKRRKKKDKIIARIRDEILAWERLSKWPG